MNLKSLSLPVSILLSFSILASENKESLISFLPEDTLLAIEIDKWEGIQDDLVSGPWGKIMDFPIWGKIKDKIEDELQILPTKNSKSNLDDMRKSVLDPMMDSIDGALVCGISDFSNLLEQEMIKSEEDSLQWKAQKMPFFALIFESSLTGDEFDEMISMIEEIGSYNMELVKEKMGMLNLSWFLHPENQEVTKFDPESTGFCVSLHEGKFFLLTGDKERIESVFATFSSPVKSLKDNEHYIDCFEEIGRGQARLFLNFKEGMRAFREKSDMMKIPQNPLGIETNGLMDGLGLYGLNHLGIYLDADSKEFEMGSSLGMGKRDGILSFLAPVRGDLENHAFISKNVFTATNAKNDLGQLWPRIENMLREISPALYLLVTSQIQAFEDQSEVEIRTDLLGSLGDDMISLSFLHDDIDDSLPSLSPSSSIYAIRLRDPKLFDRTMRAMVDSVSKGNEFFKESEHRGVAIRSMRGLEGAGLSLAYAIADDWLLLSMGKARYLNQLINQMNKSKNSLWESAFIQNALDDLPRGIRQVDYVDFSKMFSFFQVMFEAIDENDFAISPEDFGEFPYFLLGWSKDTDNGFISRAKLYPFSE